VSVGTVLNTARIGQRRTVEDVSAATRIRPGVVRALERDDYESCGGIVYARGHVRSLAAELRIDPAPLLDELTRDAAGHPAPPTPLARAAPLRERRQGGRWIPAAALVLGVVVGLAGLRLVLSLAAASSRPPTSVSAGTPTASARPAPQARNTPLAVPARGVTASIKVTGARCWVSARGSDGRRRFASTLTRGQTIEVTDPKRLVLVLGDAAAAHLVVNGRRVSRLGGTAGVARLLVEPGKRVQRLDRGGGPRR
jgi:cytoskeletal protein RodZ